MQLSWSVQLGWWSSLLIHLSCLEDDVFIFRSSASSTSENTTQSMFYPFIKNRTTRLCNNYERIPSKDQRNKHEQNTEHEREHHNSQSYLLLVFTACVKILIKQFSMKSYFGWNNKNFSFALSNKLFVRVISTIGSINEKTSSTNRSVKRWKWALVGRTG